MAKIILEFDGVDEASDARIALDGHRWRSLVIDIDNKMRETTKYENSIFGGKCSDEELKIAEKYREFVGDLLKDYGLNFD